MAPRSRADRLKIFSRYRLPQILLIILGLAYLDLLTGYRMYALMDVLHEHRSWQFMLNRLLAQDSSPPSWNPFTFCGSPLMADPEFMTCYPPAVLYRLLPFEVAHGWFLCLHWLVAGLAMYVFLARQGLTPHGRILGAVSFSLSSHLGLVAFNAQSIASASWLPLIVVGVVGTASVPMRVMLSATALSWQALAGQPQYLIYGASLLGLVTFSRLRFQEAATKLASTGGLAIALSAVCILPFLVYLVTETTRGTQLGPGMLSLDVMRPSDLLGLLFPYWPHAHGMTPLQQLRSLWASHHFVGLATLTLGIATACALRAEHSVRTATAGTVMAIMLAVLPSTPMWAHIVRGLPFLAFFRHSALWMVISDFCIAWLAACGVDHLGKKGAHAMLRLTKGIASLFLTTTILLGALRLISPAWLSDTLGFEIMLKVRRLIVGPGVFVPTLISACFLIVVLSPLVRRRSFRSGLLIIGTCVELVACRKYLITTVPSAWCMKPTLTQIALDQLVQKGAPSTVRTAHWPPQNRPGYRDSVILRATTLQDLMVRTIERLAPNLQALAGAQSIDGDNPLIPVLAHNRLADLKSRLAWDKSVETKLLLMGVNVVLSGAKIPALGSPHLKTSSLVMYMLRGSLPLITTSVPCEGNQLRLSDVSAPGLWTGEVRSSHGCIVTVRETAARGWKLFVNERRSTFLVSASGFLSFRIPPGTSHFILKYDPVMLRLGFFLSALAAGFICIVCTFRIKSD